MIGDLRTLVLFYKRHLRVQPLRELMAVGGVAAGVALLFAVQVAHHSITGSFREITHGVAGRATLEVAARGPEGFNERVAEEIERLHGVAFSAPILQEPVRVAGPKGIRALTLVGADEQVVPLRGRLSREFQRAGESSRHGLIVLTESTAHAIGVKPADELRLLIGERTVHLALAATVSSADLGAAAGSPIAAAPLPIVQSVAHLQGRVSRVLIEARPTQEDSVRRLLKTRFGGRLNVRGVDSEGKLLAQAVAPEAQVTLLFGVISLVGGVILAFNAMLLASGERREFVSKLIEIGTPDSKIIASLAFDALILGVTGSVLGLALGDVVSLLAYQALPGYIAAAFAIGGLRIVTAEVVLLALAGGMIAAFAAAGLPAISILRASADAEPAAVGRALLMTRRLRLSDTLVFAAGALIAAASVILALIAPGTTVIALVGLIAGLVVCLPLTTRYVLHAARGASRRSSDPAIQLSLAELRSAPTRAVALVATGTVAAFMMVLIGGSVANVKQAASRGATDLLSSATLWVKPGGPENVYTTSAFRYQETQQRLLHLAVVSSVLPWRDSFLDLTRRRVWVLGVPPQTPNQIAPSQLISGNLSVADRRLREGGWVAVSEPIAREQHTRLGGTIVLPTPAGNTTFRVAATIANYGWLPGAIVMNADEHAHLWSADEASQLAVTLKPAVSIEAGRRAIEGALPPGSALAVKTIPERRAEVSSVLGSTLSRLNDTTLVVLIVTIVSVIALMVAAIWQRRGRLNFLMSIGMSTDQFRRLVIYESGSVLLCGCTIGATAGLLGQALIDGWLHQTTGASVRYAPAWGTALETIALAALISLIASLIAVGQTGGFQPRAAFSTD
jgi:putative ABC transport system permease protein